MGRTSHEAVGRSARDQVVELAACPLCGDGEPAVFDKAAVVDQVEDVLAGGPAAGVVPTLNGVRPGGVLGERPSAQQLGVVVTQRYFGHWAGHGDSLPGALKGGAA
ncbi:hypothetical protein MPHO_38390 [Mycolicibacterium phocaicum]|nr:hypothetical protein MPHO_38390 [Mycolicibacterium phocaicum]